MPRKSDIEVQKEDVVFLRIVTTALSITIASLETTLIGEEILEKIIRNSCVNIGYIHLRKKEDCVGITK